MLINPELVLFIERKKKYFQTKENSMSIELEVFEPKRVNSDYINMELTHLGSEASI